MITCPECQKSVEDDFGMITCAHCGHIFMVGMEGVVPVEDEVSPASGRESAPPDDPAEILAALNSEDSEESASAHAAPGAEEGYDSPLEALWEAGGESEEPDPSVKGYDSPLEDLPSEAPGSVQEEAGVLGFDPPLEDFLGGGLESSAPAAAAETEGFDPPVGGLLQDVPLSAAEANEASSPEFLAHLPVEGLGAHSGVEPGGLTSPPTWQEAEGQPDGGDPHEGALADQSETATFTEEISRFAEEAEAGGGLYEYQIRIYDIGSQDIFQNLRQVLKDVGLDGLDLKRGPEGLQLPWLGAIEAHKLVVRLRGLPVHVRWKQRHVLKEND